MSDIFTQFEALEDEYTAMKVRLATALAERDALREELAQCEPYLKDGETPAECIDRNRQDIDALMTLLAAKKRPAADAHEHQFPEVDHEGTLVAYPCLLCGLPAGDALKQASEDRASFETDISRDVDVIHELERERNALREEREQRISRMGEIRRLLADTQRELAEARAEIQRLKAEGVIDGD